MQRGALADLQFHFVGGALPILGHDEIEKGLRDQFGRGLPGQLLERMVALPEATERIGDAHGVGGQHEELQILFLLLLQPRAFADIAHDDRRSGLAIAVGEERRRHLDRKTRTVRAHEIQLGLDSSCAFALLEQRHKARVGLVDDAGSPDTHDVFLAAPEHAARGGIGRQDPAVRHGQEHGIFAVLEEQPIELRG